MSKSAPGILEIKTSQVELSPIPKDEINKSKGVQLSKLLLRAAVMMIAVGASQGAIASPAESRIQKSFTNVDSQINVRTLTDHPGRATEVTIKQRSEISAFLRRNSNISSLICTGTSLANQTESMYRAVRLRAKLVCEYALSLNPELSTSIQLKETKSRNHNGRVVIVGK